MPMSSQASADAPPPAPVSLASAPPRRPSPRRRIVQLVAVAGLAAAGLGCLLAARRPEAVAVAAAPARVEVAVVAATRHDLERSIVVSGEVRPYEQVDLSAQVAGFVATMLVDIGDHVAQGQVLAELEIPDLPDQLHEASAACARARAQLMQRQAEAADSRVRWQRLQSTARETPTLIPQQDLDTASATDRADQASVAAAQAQCDQAQAQLDQLTTNQRLCAIRAPFAGVITRRYADPGAFIRGGISPSSPAMPLVRLADQQVLRLIFAVPEVAAAQVHLGAPVSITIDALGRTVPAHITRSSAAIDDATRTLDVEVDLANPDGAIIPGMFAALHLVTGACAQALCVPVAAVSHAEGGATVMVVDAQHHAHEQAVTLGMETPSRVAITAGLQPGAWVVVGERPVVDGQTPVDAQVLADAPGLGQ